MLLARSRSLTSGRRRALDGRMTPAAATAVQLRPPRRAPRRDRLRLLSFNIQAGIRTEAYHHYLTRGWQHLLPGVERMRNLDRIASVVADYDLVALQEVDGGSLRSGFVNQVEYIAQRAGFGYCYAQTNRDLGVLGQHGNGLLACARPTHVEDHKLPGMIPGRGAIVARFGNGRDALLVVSLHLSLGGGARDRQLAYVRDLVAPYRRAIVMGDLNSHLDEVLRCSPLAASGLKPAASALDGRCTKTWPSWRPAVQLDHILVSEALSVRSYDVLGHCGSDHRPVAVELDLGSEAL
jgi:endonuclease/exonuclease/phosphatase family metal-dependent hydrolase